MSLHPCDVSLDQSRRIDFPRLCRNHIKIAVSVSVRQFAGDRDFAHSELLAFLNIENQEVAIALFGQFGINRNSLKIHVTTRLIEIAQDLTVKFDAILDQSVGSYKGPEQPCLFGLEYTTQAPV